MPGEQALLRAAALETVIPENTTANLSELLASPSTSDAGVLGLLKRDLLFVGTFEPPAMAQQCSSAI